MDPSSVNSFDAVLAALALFAALMGFATGLLRSVATVAGWLAAALLAVWATPPVSTMLAGEAPGAAGLPQAVIFVGVLVAGGFLLSRFLRSAVAAFVAPIVSLPDRLAGAMLGVGRIGLVAAVLVLAVERIVPVDLQPQAFAESRLRPVLSGAGAAGLRSLPAGIEALVDRLKREHGL
ncbi:CvpA family protein [Rhodoplanes sp. TEM]|uniref:CvpA family protein n=1 Tax=Rhodoplanes tepidamans TaxID=200616 RepID=A0ABT5JI03_RHOTP|nr:MULTISPECIES: CvpA family protein [Rhodoplanes]MDC7789346.1 CvpA family protein [Rhodoplanes tepidamans]MDC7986035.1 CvpA family protein [Rhodoplanes sp. TEM]MDQ0358975.1 membrane protein required for colicin V production [Rhodoplanes tepidamans]